ncbi:ribosome production factor 1 [Decorospora gaudefroyi]|uniref:Ribosome production factor 1 n=1 Tax=Decorospora gaudefroyi TaxID=184978 RepID=A0A6A5K7Z9_9PLEO|nr:ribosome production factor 1 [Decorospora gaudefroyi]
MAYSKNSTASGLKPKNKLRRQAAFLSIKKARESDKRDARLRRKREEDKDPSLRETRLAQNKPTTIDAKRVWDEPVGDEEDALGWAIDVERLAKRRKSEQEEAEKTGEHGAENADGEEEEGVLAKLKKLDQATKGQGALDDEVDDEADSMLDSEDSELDSDSDLGSDIASSRKRPANRASSPSATSTATNMELSPEFLKKKFPQIFDTQVEEPKILITTSLNSTLHKEAEIFTSLFPNSTYIRRSKNFHAHKYSVREIASFASARGFTALVIVMQAHHKKEIDGIDIIPLPSGPHVHFSVSNWIEGRKLPRHANDSGHYPELILNQFKTPLGILTAHLFKNLFPAKPELEGRQVLTLHNQRDYIFVRRHRYVFRDKRESEKPILGTDGKPIPGVEDVKVGMQEIGPRMTLKLRRIDRGIQHKSGQEWQWKGRMDKQRTRFNL